jgi:hypothetical protein
MQDGSVRDDEGSAAQGSKNELARPHLIWRHWLIEALKGRVTLDVNSNGFPAHSALGYRPPAPEAAPEPITPGRLAPVLALT